ncbi:MULTISPECIES: hypothetical protein [Bradyrhizobium]|uniref:Uncharacterized protein n=2 Tax=Bradyrhizobium TaxID=374 RepID=A0ABY0QF90_9BRAD|nr:MULTISPECIES: hypothetical protein [Bradyrhizobium]SDK14560.1 hypothetical protein SAMN05444163_7353 [Bradyrhizobium ottawaense]SEE50708.1 hypothetical protein SAMN05444171_7778 [Bradyrhizobium lablabi]
MMGIIRDWAAYTNGAQGVPEDMREDHRDMRVYMGQAHSRAINRHNGSLSEAKKDLAEAIERDRRFDPYDKKRLLDRFSECWGSGQLLDFSDPGLLHGGQSRPERLKTSTRPMESPPIKQSGRLID